MDIVSNLHGLKLIDLCKFTSLQLTNSRLVDDLSGSYTFVNNQGSSVIDYLLLPEHDFQPVKNFKVSMVWWWMSQCKNYVFQYIGWLQEIKERWKLNKYVITQKFIQKVREEKRRKFEMSNIREIESLRNSKPNVWKLISKKLNLIVQSQYEIFMKFCLAYSQKYQLLKMRNHTFL